MIFVVGFEFISFKGLLFSRVKIYFILLNKYLYPSSFLLLISANNPGYHLPDLSSI